MTDSFKVGVGSAMSHFLFTAVMNRVTDEVRQESQWTAEVEECSGDMWNKSQTKQDRIHECE